MTELPAIILAGGRASRMGGGDKGLLPVGGRVLLERVIARLERQCAPLALSANGDVARFAQFGLSVYSDSLPDQPGPLAGILAGLDWAAGLGAPAVISVAADTPFFPADLARKLTAHAGPSGLALAATRDDGGHVTQHPTFGRWPTSLREDLRLALRTGHRRVRDFARLHDPGFAIWPGAPVDPFFNVNTPGDLARAQVLCSAF
ncbi:molybdenum cofactor guanylyltransferase MobA [Paracoccus salsus]|uniref:molybdenum cofactor guanylyltransferase MobA n=1 Tax=Paracoccus salsus TaxID=2911061 RepID=UPI001F17D207|nr:molybdenum cofactor guanylyltransferase MobA [Paracoccus salsus]MCF3973344.1 molybdenum cofactor guanylyltransferase MobA [Paracoccus salsus]